MIRQGERRQRGPTGAVCVATAMGLLSTAAMPCRAHDIFEAAAKPDTATVELEEIVVTALRGQDALHRIPAAAFALTRRQLARSAAPRLSTMLQNLPGLHAYRQDATGDAGVVDPRGFTANGESSYLKVLVNGQDSRDLENGNVDWDWVPPENVERIEVIEGPGAWAYGDGAEGGIVNIVMREPPAGRNARAALRTGSFGFRAATASVAAIDSWWRAAANGSARETDGWRQRSREEVASASVGLSQSFGSQRRLSVDATWLDSDREDPGALMPDEVATDRTRAETSTDFTRSRRLLVGARLEHRSSSREQWTLAPFLRTEKGERVRTIFFEPGFHPTEGLTAGAELGWKRSAELAGRPLVFSAGYLLEQAHLKTDHYEWLGDRPGLLLARGEGERETQSAYASAQHELNHQVTARAGMRGDFQRFEFDDRRGAGDVGTRRMSAASPFVALSRAIGGRGLTYVSASGAFRVPTLNQLFDQRPLPGAIPGGVTISNPDLEPQRSWNVEWGVRLEGPRQGQVALTIYSARVRNEIDFDLATISYANIGKSWHRGALVSVQQPFGRWATVEANGTYSPTTIRGGPDDANQINAVPLGMGHASLALATSDAWSVEAGVRYVARQYLDKTNEHPLADHTTVEIGGSARMSRARVAIRIANLLDEEFSDTGFIGAIGEERLVPAAGRSFAVSVSVE